MEGAPALHGGEVELYLEGHFLPEPSVTGCSFSPFGNVAEPQGILRASPSLWRFL